jgi:hypothetical protein
MKVVIFLRYYIKYLFFSERRISVQKYQTIFNYKLLIIYFYKLYITVMGDIENYIFTASIFKYSIFGLYLKFKKNNIN